ncbi:hypothetical protein GIW70_25050 [Pseudomonas syringae]|nr:hypothetical protein [Pseudomonas syringae]
MNLVRTLTKCRIKKSPAWKDVPTATLEDFKMKDDPSLLYTPEALEAALEQDELEYKRLLKEMWI